MHKLSTKIVDKSKFINSFSKEYVKIIAETALFINSFFKKTAKNYPHVDEWRLRATVWRKNRRTIFCYFCRKKRKPVR